TVPRSTPRLRATSFFATARVPMLQNFHHVNDPERPPCHRLLRPHRTEEEPRHVRNYVIVSTEEDVGAGRGSLLGHRSPAGSGGTDPLCSLGRRGVDDSFVDLLGRPDPLGLAVPGWTGWHARLSCPMLHG